MTFITSSTRERLEVELVAGGVVGGDGLGVVVDDDGLVAALLDGLDGVDGGVVELHALADADGAAAQHDDLAAGPRRWTRFPPRRWSRSTGT